MSADNEGIRSASDDLFNQIAAKTDIAAVKRKMPKSPGRPKKLATVEAEAEARRQKFSEKFSSITSSRQEPQKFIDILSLPEDQQQEALENAMTPRMRAFCKEYVVDFSGAKAVVRAGYSTKNPAQSAALLMRYKSVRKLIDFYTASPVRKMVEIDPAFVISKVTEIVQTAAKDSDKLRGLELLAKHLGMFIERQEITGKDGGAIQLEETQKKADEVARQLRSMAGRAGPLTVIK